MIAKPRPDFLSDFSTFVAYLRTNYGDPDELGTARRKLKALRQVSSASAYFAEFQQYLAVLGWKDQDPIVDRAIEGLKSHLKDEVARKGDRPTSLAELIAFVVPLDNRLHEREQERRRETKDPVKEPETRRPVSSVNGTMSRVTEVSATPAHIIRRTTTSAYTPPPRGPLSEQERKRRYDLRLCLYCGEPGHTANACPVRRTTPNVAAPTPPPAGNVRGPST